MRARLALGVLFLSFLSCQEAEPLLRERPASETGIQFGNFLEESPELNILNYLYYYNGAGVLAADLNNDGLTDLYFAANQKPGALYLNQGGLKFTEATKASGLSNTDGWTTGVTHVDINADGWLDIYISQASGYRNLKGRNRLYVNQGAGADGVPRFKEQAADYGLDIEALSTQAAFFDMDGDGDLDAFLMNHSVHPNRNYGRGSQRQGFDALAGDRLLRNDNGVFTDISNTAGIYQGKAGYGLGLGISDLDANGYPDIYIGNDFFENDYLYMNQQGNRFSEGISTDSSRIGHTSHFSMGHDIADLNNDGLPEIFSLDMLPEDLLTYKTSGLEYAYPIYKQYLSHGFAPQYMQNTLQLNLGGGRFSEIGFLGGIAGTEWSWGTLLADFDNDRYRDIFITNGIKGATNDMDYMNFIANEDIQRRIDAGMEASDMPLTQEIPEKKVPNYIFRNNGDLQFTNVGGQWMTSRPTFSQGCTYADLDNDGDLDLVVNHMNETASVFENTQEGSNGVSIAFKGPEKNPFGIGARVMLYADSHVQMGENFTTRGYLSAVPPEIHFGLGASATADSVVVTWPDGHSQTLVQPTLGNRFILDYQDAHPTIPSSPSQGNWSVTDRFLEFTHKENPILDFDREPLIVFAGSNKGPALAVADLDKDGWEDLVIGGAKRQASAVYYGSASGFAQRDTLLFAADALSEDTALLVFDANGDGWPDLMIGSGGNEFQEGDPLRPRLYLNEKGRLAKAENAFKNLIAHAGALGNLDMDGDGDQDVLIASDAVPGAFGATPEHFLLENDGQGHFTEVELSRISGLAESGAISRMQWADFNGDGKTDLAVAGAWSPLRVFLQTDHGWTLDETNGLGQTHGWWNALRAEDLDGDGDMDLVAGNWGLNSKFRASTTAPVNLYRNDFDQNGRAEAVVTYYHHGVETPFASKDELSKQMPFLNKKFRTYRGFAQASLAEVFGADALSAADRKSVYMLESCIFRNDGSGRFTKEVLPPMAQVSTVFDVAIEDFSGDGLPDLLLVGNNYDISTQLGRLDALHGVLLVANSKGGYHWSPQALPALPGAARQVARIRLGETQSWIIGRNNDTPLFLTQRKTK